MVDKNSQANHWAGKDKRIIQSYWDSPPATKRSKWFVEQLKGYEFETLWEIGCFSGRNLRYIQEEFPKAHLWGFDVNAKAIQFAEEKLPKINFSCMDLHDFGELQGNTDIIFTSGVLIHVPPKDLGTAISGFLKQKPKLMMHIEQLGENEVCAGPKQLRPTYKVSDQIQWNPDLVSIYKGMGYNPDVVTLPDDCKTNGAAELVVVRV